MHIQIQKEELLKSLTIVEKAIAAKTVIDSLRGIKIDVYDDKIIFTTSKQDLAITYTLTTNFTCIKKGSTILPGSYLINIIKKTNEEMIELHSENNTMLLKTAKSKINLVEFDLSSYPEIRFEKDNQNEFIISKKLLHKAYRQNKAATAINPVKPILTGINFAVNPESLIVSSTDARRLAISTFAMQANVTTNFTISKPLYADIIKVIDLLDEDQIAMATNRSQIIIKGENILIKARLLEGEYPQIDRLIPTTSNYSYIVDSSQLQLTLEKILLLSERDNANVTAKINNNSLELSSYFKELGGIEELCDIELLEGTPFDISFDPVFLLDAIHSINKEKLEIKFVDEISAFSINGVGLIDNVQVISPIRMA